MAGAKSAGEITFARVMGKRHAAANRIQKQCRRILSVWSRRKRFCEILCGRKSCGIKLRVYTILRMRQVLRAMKAYARNEEMRWARGVVFDASRVGLVYINGESKQFPRKLVVSNDSLSVRNGVSGDEIYHYGFQEIKQVSLSRCSKREVQINLHNKKVETYNVVNASGFMIGIQWRKRRLWRRLHLDEDISEDEPDTDFIPTRTICLPSEADCVDAVGDTHRMPKTLARAFDIRKDKHGMFSPMQAPWKDEWLALNPQKAAGQTFNEWYAGDHIVPAGSGKSKLYVVAIGKFGGVHEPSSPQVRTLVQFLKSFFYGVRVESLPTMPLKGIYRDRGMKLRVDIKSEKVKGMRLESLRHSDLLSVLKHLVPFDAFSLLAVTMHPVHDDSGQDGSFVTLDDVRRGRSLRRRRCVVSFAPVDPWSNIFDPSTERNIITPEETRRRLLIRRSFQWLAQHVIVLFGIEHCVFHSCVMNGYIHLDEMMIVPLQLCPVCLRKVHHSIGIRTTQRCCDRYSSLRGFCNTQPNVFDREIAWYGKRVEVMELDRVRYEK